MTGREQLAQLLPPGVEQPGKGEPGYIDLLGPSDPIGSAFLQRAMGSRLMPHIYERLWRPLASRAFFGVLGPSPAKERRMALAMLAISPGDRVLDVGCGPGNFTRHLANPAVDGLVAGLDASETMLTAAAKRDGRPNLAYVRGDAAALPFAANTFEAVCCFGTLHLVEDPEQALDELTRVLSPGGRLALMATWARRERPPRRLKGVRVFGRDELVVALTERGFAHVEQQVAGWGQFLAGRKHDKQGVE